MKERSSFSITANLLLTGLLLLSPSIGRSNRVEVTHPTDRPTNPASPRTGKSSCFLYIKSAEGRAGRIKTGVKEGLGPVLGYPPSLDIQTSQSDDYDGLCPYTDPNCHLIIIEEAGLKISIDLRCGKAKLQKSWECPEGDDVYCKKSNIDTLVNSVKKHLKKDGLITERLAAGNPS
jgi:hypothetical protein